MRAFAAILPDGTTKTIPGYYRSPMHALEQARTDKLVAEVLAVITVEAKAEMFDQRLYGSPAGAS